MKKVLFGCLMVLANNVLANPYIVTGKGLTEEEARVAALSKAIEQSRSIIVSERVASNDKLVKNEVIAYSSAYIDKYNVLLREYDGQSVTVKMQVWVDDNKLAERLILTQSKPTGVIDRDQVDRVDSFIKSRKDTIGGGTRILKNVLDDYPVKALRPTIVKQELIVDRNGNYLYRVRFKVDWQNNYLNALGEALQPLRVEPIRNYCGECYVEIATTPFTMFNKVYEISDAKLLHYIFGQLSKDVNIEFSLKRNTSGNQNLFSHCYSGYMHAGQTLQIKLGMTTGQVYNMDIPYTQAVSDALKSASSATIAVVDRCN